MRTPAAALVLIVAACDTGEGPVGRTEEPPPDAPSGFYFDFGAPDALPPPPDATPADPEVCTALCGMIADCAAAEGPDGLCDAIGPEQRDEFAGLCTQICLDAPVFATTFAGRMECEPLLQQMRAVSPDLAYTCVPFPPPETPECNVFGARVAECVGEVCAPAVPVAEGLGYWLALSCHQSVAAGQILPDQLMRLPMAETPCDDPVAEGIVQSLVGSATDRRTLTSLCLFGPALPEDTCGAACEHLRPCVAPRSPLRNPGYCEFLCAVDGSLADVLSCAAMAPECGPLGTCF